MDLQNILAWFGALHLIAFIAGATIPGISYHCMFGGDISVKEWHKKLAGEDE